MSVFSSITVYAADASTIITNAAKNACGNNCGNPSAVDLFGQFSNALIYIVGALSVVMIIVGGLRYTISNGDPKNTAAARQTITYAVAGLVISIIAFAVVNFIISRF